MVTASPGTQNTKQQVMALVQQQRFPEARELCTTLCRQTPGDAHAWFLLSAIHGQLGNFKEAEKCSKKVVKLQPNNPGGFYNLGIAQYNLGKTSDAAGSIRQALQLKPDLAEASFVLGNILFSVGQFSEAADCYQKVLKTHPQNTDALNNLGNSLKNSGDRDGAVKAYRQAIELKPDHADAHSNLGTLLLELKLPDQALHHLQTAVHLNPGGAEAHYNLGNLQQALGNLSEAKASYRKALELKPDLLQAHINLGNTMVFQGRHQEAEVNFRHALSLNDSSAIANSAVLFCMNYHTDYDASKIFSAHCDWGKRQNSATIPHQNDNDPDRPLRIGYVSPDFRNHPVATFIEPLLALHNDNNFEIYAYAELTQADAYTEHLKSLCAHWKETQGKSDSDVAGMIRDDKIDILVDLAGHSNDNRLQVFALKPAPVQLTYLGYPNTTGLESVDYRFTDSHADPEGYEKYYSESLIRLTDCFLCYQAPDNAPPVAAPPAIKAGHITFGSFNNLAKINESVVSLWASILDAVPESRLLLKSKPLADSGTADRIRDMFLEHGIAAEQLELLGWAPTIDSHLELYDQIDIALDTFPYNGTTTTCEALWMGVPVVALEGDQHAGRVGVSLLRNIGESRLIADTQQHYRDIAVSLAGDIEELSSLRESLRKSMQHSPLCNARAFTDSVESAYRMIWKTWCRNNGS